MLDEKFVAKRVGYLLDRKGMSAREVSLALGQSDSYINKIENGKALPSLKMFLEICDYFDITPSAFFDDKNTVPDQLHELVEEGKKLSPEALDQIIGLMKTMNQKE